MILKLTCEFLENPLGIDNDHPRLGWKITNVHRKNYKQSAYHVLVASSVENLAQNQGDIWDSQKSISSQSQQIEYQGAKLQSRKKYYWKVKIWDENDTEEEWSDFASWTMGIFHQDWKAQWIGMREEVSWDDRFPISAELKDCPKIFLEAARREHPKGSGPENDYAAAVYLRKDFELQKKPECAIMRICGLGYYEMYINGQKVGDHVLDPGATDYSRTVYYVNYDVSNYLQEGNNAIGIVLGNSWYWVGTPDLFEFDKANWAAPPRCAIELEMSTDPEHGNLEYLYSDSTWEGTERGPIRFNCIRSGEVFDARKTLEDWNSYQDASKKALQEEWQPVKLVNAPEGILRSQLYNPIRVRKIQTPYKIVELPDGRLVYWFAQNNAGWISLKIQQAQAGQVIKIEMNEVLNSDGSVDMYKNSGHTYGRFQTCEYICKGVGIESWHPTFTYAGFQYVQITGATKDQILELNALQVCTDFEESGTFYCSNHLINSINEAAKLTFLNGYHSYPEDCPQREKAGWTEDGLISSFGSVYNFDAQLPYEKWINDFRDAQHLPTGQVPDIVPTYLWGKPEIKTSVEEFLKENPNNLKLEQAQVGRMADPWWGGILVMLPWQIYRQYGDVQVLKRSYEAMKKYGDFLVESTFIEPGIPSYIINWGTILGDWLEVGAGGSANRTPKQLTTTIAFYNCINILQKTAQILGYQQDSAKYGKIKQEIKEAFNEEFLQSEGIYWQDSQSAQAMALYLGLAPEDQQKAAFSQLLKNIADHDTHLTTGIVGTYYLYQALAYNNRADIVYDIITAKGFPGFEHLLTRVKESNPIPSGTIWEDWGGVSSLAHPVQGCVSSFFYEHLAGIQPLESDPGFKRFFLKPAVLEKLEWVQCTYNTLYGEIKVHWQRKGGDLIVDITIPPNTEAEYFPPINITSTKESLGSGHHQFRYPL